MTPTELKDLARKGAPIRMAELTTEIMRLRRTFPDLFQEEPRHRKPMAKAETRKQRRKLSPAERHAISRRMARYWAERRKAAR